jgi:phosphopantetheinyl transferase
MHPPRQHLRRTDKVDVWMLRTGDHVHYADVLAACLSAAELARADRLLSEAARRRFIVERAVLRRILASRVGMDAGSVEVITTSRGKPALRAHPDVWFSLSHSRQLTLIAVAGVAVGIDVEHPRALRHIERTAARVLHADTVALLQATPEPRRTLMFLDAWTLREAHVKAVGGGLFHTPDTLPFNAHAADRAVEVAALTATGSMLAQEIVRTARDRAGSDVWSVAHFRPEPDARAALVAHGHVRTVTFTEWKGDTHE